MLVYFLNLNNFLYPVRIPKRLANENPWPNAKADDAAAISDADAAAAEPPAAPANADAAPADADEVPVDADAAPADALASAADADAAHRRPQAGITSS